MGWNGMEPNGIEGSEVSCSGMEFYGMASNRIEYNMMEGNGKMGYNETGHFSLWLCSFHLFLSIFALKENIKVSEKTTTRPRLVTSPSILLYTRAWSESKSKPGGLLSVWVCTCMDATRVSENIARNEIFFFFLSLFDWAGWVFWQLLADVDLLYFHRGQPQHRELHSLLFSNSVWVL